ncbi:MAG: fatty acid-binding protein DegV [Actinomycetia bacterium]|nr:fatty acid-binding protein DegV [Actinomycetes bacterium]
MPVSVVTDSAAALPRAMPRNRSIEVVPMWLTIDGTSIREGEMALDELLTHSDVKTSGPSPGEFEATIARCLDFGDDGVVVLTIASAMSSTHEAAVLGAQAAGGPVRVVDTKTAAGAQALVVLAAADASARGESLDAVVGTALAAIPQMRLAATVPTLEHLVRGGRVPNIAGWAGRRLGIAPLFEFRDGRAHPLRPALGMTAAYDRILARWRRGRVPDARLHVAALHADAPVEAENLLDRVRAEAEPATAFVAEFGSVMVAHTGPGLVGLAWRWEPLGES